MDYDTDGDAGPKQMVVHHVDVKSVYLHGLLKEEIYMNQPKGFLIAGMEHFACKLQRSLYGLKQEARLLNKSIHALLSRLCRSSFHSTSKSKSSVESIKK